MTKESGTGIAPHEAKVDRGDNVAVRPVRDSFHINSEGHGNAVLEKNGIDFDKISDLNGEFLIIRET